MNVKAERTGAPGPETRVRIRTMRLEDSAAVAELATQLGYPSTAEQIERRFATIREAPDAQVWVAENAEGAVVGWLHLYGTRQIESEPYAEIGGLVVEETARGRGIGRALMETAEASARERGYAVVRVRSNVIRTQTHEFYKGLGYEVVKSQVRFRKKL